MSELAFDANGEPIVLPASAEELRVRLFRSPGMRGACEVVHDKEGGALYIPVDTSYLEFRQRVDGVPGRYRLDPVDAQRKVLSNATPAYVTISTAPRNSASASGPDERDSLIRDLVRANVEMATAISDRFANVMDRFANVVEVAVGAKQARLEPAPVIPTDPDGADDEDDDQDLDDAGPDSALETAKTIERIATKGFEALNKWIMSRAMRPAETPATAAASAPAPTSTATPSAPAVAGTSSNPPAPAAPRNIAPTPIAQPTADQFAHVAAVRDALDPDERTVCDAVVMKLSEAQRAHWLGELCAMTVEQAVAQVRELMPPLRRRTDSAATPAANQDGKESAP
jgi:hypothetical protein